MICPVCEHPQEVGFECEVCGKDLASLSGLEGLGPPPVSTEAVEGLEVTIPDKIGDVAVERVGDLEVTRFAVGPDLPLERVPELEETSAAAVGDVPLEHLADMTDDRAPDDGVRTPVATGAVTCRYCRRVQAEGKICEGCGMALPRALEPMAGTKGPQGVLVRCKACGSPSFAGEPCRQCGRQIPAIA